MYLSKCIINGFKSFADKVEVNFNQGLSAVVGPNGCGKSNIYEAIMWVLGEQRPRSLRSSKMEDVIFSGSSARPEVGMAEVAIILADPERQFIDTAEVQITRRLFRSGQSEYYINGNSCRLKDINKMLANTGIGKNSYAFIGQGKVEAILQARPHELRLFFEEAAGIAHYKEQKFTTEAQLSKTDDSIVRIDDLISELQVDVDNLKVRAEKAIKHQELTSKLTQENKELLISEYIISKTKLDSIREKLKTLKYNLATNSIEQDSLNSTIVLYETKIFELQELKNDTEKDLIRLDNTVQNYKTKVSELELALQRAKSNSSIKQQELTEQSENQNQIISSIDSTAETLRRLNVDLELNNHQLVDVTLKIEEFESKISQLNIDDLEKEKSVSEQKIGSLTQRSNDIADRLDSAKVKSNQLSKRYGDLTENKRQESLKLRDLKTILSSYNSEKCALLEEQERLKTLEAKGKILLENHRKEISQLQDKRRNYASQLTLYQKLKSEYTGYYTGVKSVLLAKKANPEQYENILGVVTELINVPEQLQIAVSSVLGGQAQYLVSSTARDATKAISMLKEKKAGKATFLPLDRIEPRYNAIPNQILANDCFMGRAIELIKYDSKTEIAIKYLLNNVLVVKTVNAALDISRLKLRSFLIVALSGEVFSGNGLISGGKNKNDYNTELLARDKKITGFQVQLKKTIDSLALKDSELRKETQEFNQLCAKLELNNSRLNFVDNEVINNEKKEFFYETTINKIATESKEIALEIKELDQSIGKYQKLNTENKELIIKSNSLLISSSDELENARKTVKKLNEYRQLATNISSEVRLIETKINNACVNIENLKKNKEIVDKQLEKLLGTAADLKNTIVRLQQEQEVNRNNLREWTLKLEKQTLSLKNVTSKYLKVTEEQVKSNEQLSSLKSLEDQINRNILRNDRRLVEQETIHKFIDAEMYQAGIPVDECLREKPVTSRIVEQLKINVNKLKNLISGLGDVDYGAIADLKRRQERIDFLDQQKADLEEAKLKLLEIISNIDKTCYDKLAETIEIVTQNFKECYTELFQGGNADIYWDIEDNIFNSGIVLNVSPPGKKVQNMEQLSGGEKSLTAIALLLAFTKLKSSSFCIFDEVDAALDETNNIRLANYWQSIAKSTQVIAITHSRHTMVHADYLFGVVMQEKGVSKVISVALDK